MNGRILIIGMLALLVAVAAPASATEIVAVDEGHGLNDEKAVEAYEDTGTAAASVTAPALDLTVTKQASDAGVDTSPITDATTSYLNVTYRNDKPVTVRLYLDPAYSDGVYVSEGEELAKGHGTADIDVADEGDYLAVTLSFSESGSKVVPLSSVKATHYGVVDSMGSRFGGIDVGASEDWQYVEASALQGDNATHVVQTAEPDKLVVQFERNTSDGQTEWVSVPGDADASAPVFTMRKDGVDDAVYLVSETADAPQTRFKLHRTTWDRIGVSIDGLNEMVDQMMADINGLFGGF